MHKFALKIIYIEYHIFFLLEIITIYTSKNYNKIVEISLSESLWGNSTYRQSSCSFRKKTTAPPRRLIVGKNNEYANI